MQLSLCCSSLPFPTCLSPVDNAWCYAYAGRQNMQLDKRAVYVEENFDLAATSDVAVPSCFCPCILCFLHSPFSKQYQRLVWGLGLSFFFFFLVLFLVYTTSDRFFITCSLQGKLQGCFPSVAAVLENC